MSIQINYKSICNITQLNTTHVTSPLCYLKFIFQLPITSHMNHILGSRCNNTHQFHNKQLANIKNYTKTQAYIQCDTM